MVRRGAKNIVLVSRSDKISPKVAEVIQDAKELGAKVVVRLLRRVQQQEVESMIAEINAEMPPRPWCHSQRHGFGRVSPRGSWGPAPPPHA